MSDDGLTIENFVDFINEVLLQTGGTEETFQKIQNALHKYLEQVIDFDEFGFEFAMLMKEAK